MFIKNITAAARWTYASEYGVDIPYGLSLELRSTKYRSRTRNQRRIFTGVIWHHLTATAVTKHCTSPTLPGHTSALLGPQNIFVPN